MGFMWIYIIVNLLVILVLIKGGVLIVLENSNGCCYCGCVNVIISGLW